MAHRGVVGLRGHEADAGLGQAALDVGDRAADGDAERAEHVAGARARGGGAVAVLGDGNAAGRGDDRRQRRDVEGAVPVAAGADDVHRAGGRRHPQHAVSHRRHRAGDFGNGLPAHAKPHEKGAHLCGCRLAREQQVKGGLGLGARQRGPRRDRRQQRLQRVH